LTAADPEFFGNNADFDGDLLLDRRFWFYLTDTELTCDDVEVRLTGQTYAGLDFFGLATFQTLRDFQDVRIDLLPSDTTNTIYCMRDSILLPVVVYSTAQLDTRLLELSSVRLGSAFAIDLPPEHPSHGNNETDFDLDGLIDRLFWFWFSNTGIQCGDQVVTLTGTLSDGRVMDGFETIVTLSDEPGARIDLLLEDPDNVVFCPLPPEFIDVVLFSSPTLDATSHEFDSVRAGDAPAIILPDDYPDSGPDQVDFDRDEIGRASCRERV